MDTLRAEITGDDRATCNGLEAQHNAPVLALCRKLIAAGHDPVTALEAYRGDVLCLRVRSIGEAARLTVEETGTGPRFVKFKAFDDARSRLKGAGTSGGAAIGALNASEATLP